jgi:limonene-1,2-epoxide hydrolase
MFKSTMRKMQSDSTSKSTASQTSAEQATSRLVEAYQRLGEGDSALIEALYADDIYFEDPTQGTQGKAALMMHIDRTFSNISNFSFKSHRMLTSDNDVFISWTQIFNHKKLARGKTLRVEGATYLKTRNGKIYYQRDYFDLGAVVYENLPILGPIIKLLRSRLK